VLGVQADDVRPVHRGAAIGEWMLLAVTGARVRNRGDRHAGLLERGDYAARCLALPELGSQETDDVYALDVVGHGGKA
jgi:hypothetical protein